MFQKAKKKKIMITGNKIEKGDTGVGVVIVGSGAGCEIYYFDVSLY